MQKPDLVHSSGLMHMLLSNGLDFSGPGVDCSGLVWSGW